MRVNVWFDVYRISEYVDEIRRKPNLQEIRLNMLCYKEPRVIFKTLRRTLYELYYDEKDDVFVVLDVYEPDYEYIHTLEDKLIFIHVGGNGINTRSYKIIGKATRSVSFHDPCCKIYWGTFFEVKEIAREELEELIRKYKEEAIKV